MGPEVQLPLGGGRGEAQEHHQEPRQGEGGEEAAGRARPAGSTAGRAGAPRAPRGGGSRARACGRGRSRMTGESAWSAAEEENRKTLWRRTSCSAHGPSVSAAPPAQAAMGSARRRSPESGRPPQGARVPAREREDGGDGAGEGDPGIESLREERQPHARPEEGQRAAPPRAPPGGEPEEAQRHAGGERGVDQDAAVQAVEAQRRRKDAPGGNADALPREDASDPVREEDRRQPEEGNGQRRGEVRGAAGRLQGQRDGVISRGGYSRKGRPFRRGTDQVPSTAISRAMPATRDS